jgi:hypothetical protein
MKSSSSSHVQTFTHVTARPDGISRAMQSSFDVHNSYQKVDRMVPTPT